MKRSVHVYYSGRVQGVGFRFTAENLANDLGIRGWVKNLRDGRVEVLAEAEEDSLKDFLKKINDYFVQYIREADVHWHEPSEDFVDFRVDF